MASVRTASLRICRSPARVFRPRSTPSIRLLSYLVLTGTGGVFFAAASPCPGRFEAFSPGHGVFCSPSGAETALPPEPAGFHDARPCPPLSAALPALSMRRTSPCDAFSPTPALRCFRRFLSGVRFGTPPGLSRHVPALFRPAPAFCKKNKGPVRPCGKRSALNGPGPCRQAESPGRDFRACAGFAPASFLTCGRSSRGWCGASVRRERIRPR